MSHAACGQVSRDDADNEEHKEYARSMELQGNVQKDRCYLASLFEADSLGKFCTPDLGN